METSITKNESVVNIPDVADEKMVVFKDGVEVDGPDLFIDRNHHEAQGWRKRTAHGGTTELGYTSMAPTKGLHFQCRRDQGRNVLDDQFSCDIQATTCTFFDQIAWIVGTTRVDGKHLIFADIHVRT